MLNSLFSLPLALAIVLSPQAGFSEEPFDIAPFARRCCLTERHESQTTFDYRYGRGTPLSFEKAGDHFVLGLQWAEERDVENVRLIFSTPLADSNLSLQYWYRNWPYPPPEMPTIEDPVDDPWQGRWLTAATRTVCNGAECGISFLPLTSEENPRAKNLPGLIYRRTLKIRVISDRQLPLKDIKVMTQSVMKNTRIRLELGVGTNKPYVWKGHLTAYNGSITGVEGWHTAPADIVRDGSFALHTGSEPKGMIIGVQGAEARPTGSHDTTIVTVWCGERTFSFALPDVEKGSIYIPAFHAYLTLESDKEPFTPTIVKRGARIRERLAAEPEQTYERARREIPPLDPVERQGGRLYLPLASDSSWQKFAFEWGGNITIDKRGVKAKGAELGRLEWKGDRISLRVGTGEKPSFRPRSADSRLSVLEDYLPVPAATWATGQISYSEEAFVTQLSGPLGMQGRDEQVPSILIAKITARNLAASPQVSHLWLGVDPPEDLEFRDNLLLGAGGALVRALIRPPTSAALFLTDIVEEGKSMRGLHIETQIPAGREDITYVAVPFIPGLSKAERRQLTELKYEAERQRVIRYWENVAGDAVRFSVPEERFGSFSRAVVTHIHMSTTKDPRSGLLMVPAASYWYQVYANEACFQVLALDALGEHGTAADYLETLVRLQGSRPFEGTYTGDQRDVYHGARVDAEYDYTAFEYNLDHGTVLWALAEHYFITRDRTWLGHVLPSMIRAADWVIQQRRLTMTKDGDDKIPEYGLLPAGHLEDNQDWGHWFSVNAFASAGITRLGEVMLDAGHPDAGRIRLEAAAYREDLRTAVLRAAQLAPVQRLRDDTFVPYVPVRPHQRIRLFGPTRVAYYKRYPEKVLPTYRLSATREVLYGPMILLYTRVFRSREPLADWVLDDWEDNATMSSTLGLNVHGWVDDDYWFSRGGMVFQANLQNPTLIYLRRHEIPAAIRNLYNDFVSCYYPDANVFTEEYRQWRSPSGPFYKVSDEARFVNRVRDLLVLEDGQELWLTAGTPRRWLAPGQSISLDRMPTDFGPVSLELDSSAGEITGHVLLPSRTKFEAAWLVLRVPEGTRVGRVEINGKPWRDVDSATGRIRLPMVAAPINLHAAIIPE